MSGIAKRLAKGLVAVFCICMASACASGPLSISTADEVETFAPGIASTEFSEIRLTISPDGRTAMWFSRDRPGGAGGYDIWMSARNGDQWRPASPAPFNSPQRDFDPAITADGRFVYFSSDRPGGEGGDDLYRVAVTEGGFGAVEHLSSSVNSAGNEWGAMLSPDGSRLIFASNGRGGAGRFDIFAARVRGRDFEPAGALPGDLNTSADEFDATFLGDGESVIFARAPDLSVDRVVLYFAAPERGRYGGGVLIQEDVNSGSEGTYGAMLDWSSPGMLTFSSRRFEGRSVDVFRVRYRLHPVPIE